MDRRELLERTGRFALGAGLAVALPEWARGASPPDRQLRELARELDRAVELPRQLAELPVGRRGAAGPLRKRDRESRAEREPARALEQLAAIHVSTLRRKLRERNQ